MKLPAFVTKRALPRRTFLRGMGAAVALPLLDAMVPALAQAPAPRRRLGFVYVPNGIIMDQWTPATAGADFELKTILKPLEPFKDALVVVSNLARAEVNSNHAVSSACWLTGTPPKRTDGPDFRAGTSLDQLVAQAFGNETPIPSMQLCIENVDQAGGCFYGYSCAYTDSISWASPSEPLPTEPVDMPTSDVDSAVNGSDGNLPADVPPQ